MFSPPPWNYTDLATDKTQLNGAGAVLLNGVVVFDDVSASFVDPLYPKAWSGGSKTEAEMTDICLGHPQMSGMYHYHVASPCLFN